MPTAIDTHAHLYFDSFEGDLDAVVERAREGGFSAVLNIGIDVATSRACIGLAERFPGFCFAAVGLHPNEAEVSPAELSAIVAELEGLVPAHDGAVRAIGEIGLDRYRERASDAAQERAFIEQIGLARRTGRAIVIHCREAWPRTLEIIAAEAAGTRGVFHCFGGTAAEAARAVELGWFVSFAGNLTYPKAEALRVAAREVPLDRLLLETNAPFLAPQPVRGKRNEPLFALHTADTLASVHSTDRARVLDATTRNARELFRLP